MSQEWHNSWQEKNIFLNSSKFARANPWLTHERFENHLCPAAKLGKDLFNSSFVDRGSAVVMVIMT